MLSLNNGSPVQSQAVINKMAKKYANENPVPFAENQTRTESISRREFPISALTFKLKLTIGGASGAETLNPLGVYNLIRKLRVSVDGTDHRVALSGKSIEHIAWLYGGRKPFNNVNVAANGTYSAIFRLRFDVGGYNSMLYAARNTSLDVQVDWGQSSDIITGGAGSVTSAELQPIVEYVTGGVDGQLGGKDGAYVKQYLKSATIDINATKSDQEIEDLTNGRGYHGLTLFSYDNTGARSDSIVNLVEVHRTDSQHMRLEQDVIRAMNVERYDVADPADFVGVLDVPFVDPGHYEHTLSIQSDQSMRLLADVTKPGGGNGSVELVSHFFLG